MGSRLFSNTTNLLGGHDFLNPAHRAKVAGILGIDSTRIPAKNGWPYHKIIEGIKKGDIKGLWVIATNPAHSWINQSELHQIIKKLDFLVVQDMYHTTETAQVADLILPAAGWGEKEGVFINSERRLGLVKKVAQAPGQALADFYIFKLIAEAWGCGDLFKAWTSPAAVFQILKRCSAGMPCDITGVEDYAMLDRRGGIQWPLPAGVELEENERRLFADGRFYHPDGKAKFLFEAPQPLPEPTSSSYPFALLTGRGASAQWHTQSRTQKSPVLQKLYPAEIYVEINPADAQRLCIQPDEWVYVSSKRGRVKARAVVMSTVQPGHLFMPMHYPETNQLTFPAFDPYSGQPAYKHCAVNISFAK
jgi:assimilatory nitrate reductase catalytic subunit